jgi:hypothetical protein
VKLLQPCPQLLPQPKLEASSLDLVVEVEEEVKAVEVEVEEEVEGQDNKLLQQPPPMDLSKELYPEVMMEIAKA